MRRRIRGGRNPQDSVSEKESKKKGEEGIRDEKQLESKMQISHHCRNRKSSRMPRHRRDSAGEKGKKVSSEWAGGTEEKKTRHVGGDVEFRQEENIRLSGENPNLSGQFVSTGGNTGRHEDQEGVPKISGFEKVDEGESTGRLQVKELTDRRSSGATYQVVGLFVSHLGGEKRKRVRRK